MNKENYIDEILKEFDKEFIGALDKFHNRLYFEINERINKLEPEESKIEDIEKETVNRFKTFLKQKLQEVEQRKVEEIKEKFENKIKCVGFSEEPDFECDKILPIKEMQSTVKNPNRFYCKECYQRGLNMEYEAMGLK